MADTEDHRPCSFGCHSTKVVCQPEDRPIITDCTEGGILGVEQCAIGGESSTDDNILATLECGIGALRSGSASITTFSSKNVTRTSRVE
jgi:hypothetical protein